MNNTGTSTVKTFSLEELSEEGSDVGLSNLEALSDEAVREAAQSDPDAQPLTDAQLARMRPVSPARRVRQSLGMSREAFAAAFRVPLETLEAWEGHTCEPDAPARALLLAIERDPVTMRRLLASAAA